MRIVWTLACLCTLALARGAPVPAPNGVLARDASQALLEIRSSLTAGETPEQVVGTLNSIIGQLEKATKEIETSESKLLDTYGKEKAKLDELLTSKVSAMHLANNALSKSDLAAELADTAVEAAQGRVEASKARMTALQRRFRNYVNALHSAEKSFGGAQKAHMASQAELMELMGDYEKVMRVVHGGEAVVRKIPTPANELEGASNAAPSSKYTSPEAAEAVQAAMAGETGATGIAEADEAGYDVTRDSVLNEAIAEAKDMAENAAEVRKEGERAFVEDLSKNHAMGADFGRDVPADPVAATGGATGATGGEGVAEKAAVPPVNNALKAAEDMARDLLKEEEAAQKSVDADEEELDAELKEIETQQQNNKPGKSTFVEDALEKLEKESQAAEEDARAVNTEKEAKTEADMAAKEDELEQREAMLQAREADLEEQAAELARATGGAATGAADAETEEEKEVKPAAPKAEEKAAASGAGEKDKQTEGSADEVGSVESKVEDEAPVAATGPAATSAKKGEAESAEVKAEVAKLEKEKEAIAQEKAKIEEAKIEKAEKEEAAKEEKTKKVREEDELAEADRLATEAAASVAAEVTKEASAAKEKGEAEGEDCEPTGVDPSATGAYVAAHTTDVDVTSGSGHVSLEDFGEAPEAEEEAPAVEKPVELETSLLELFRTVRAHAHGEHMWICPKGYCVRATMYAAGAGPSFECFSADVPAAQATLPALPLEGDPKDMPNGERVAAMCADLLEDAEDASSIAAAKTSTADEFAAAVEEMVANDEASLTESGSRNAASFKFQEDVLLYVTRNTALIKAQMDKRAIAWHETLRRLHEYRNTVLPVLQKMMTQFKAIFKRQAEELVPAVKESLATQKAAHAQLKRAQQNLAATREAMLSIQSTFDRVDDLYTAQHDALTKRATQLRSQLLLATEIRETLKSRMGNVKDVLVGSFEKAKAQLAEALEASPQP